MEKKRKNEEYLKNDFNKLCDELNSVEVQLNE